MLCRSGSRTPFRVFAGVRYFPKTNAAALTRAVSSTRAFATSAAAVADRPDSGLGNKTSGPSAVLHRSLKIEPLQVVSADGKHLTFSNGHQILDTTCGAAVACIGYNNKRVKKAMVEQIDKFAYCNSMFFGHPIGEALATELVNGTDGVMSKAYIMCSGERPLFHVHASYIYASTLMQY